MWIGITENRELDVSYCHMQLKKIEEGKLSKKELLNPWISFKNWQIKYKDHSCPINKKKAEINEYDPSLLDSVTRKRMRWLPWIFLGIWLVGFLIFGLSYFNII